MTERALESAQAGLEKGRETLTDLLTKGQDTVSEIIPRQKRGSEPYLWFGGGALIGALALFLSQKSGLSAGWSRGYVRDVMIHDVESIDASATLREAAQKMRDANVGVLPITQGGRIKGVITDRDIVVRGMARGADPSTTRVGECATTDAVAARPDWTVYQAMSVMAERQIGRLPVVDDSDAVVGIVTLSSLALRAGEKEEALDTAKQVSRRSARAS
jgi:CBS domain-containing protein